MAERFTGRDRESYYRFQTGDMRRASIFDNREAMVCVRKEKLDLQDQTFFVLEVWKTTLRCMERALEK